MSDTKWETGPWVALPSRVRFCRWQDETPRFDDGLWHILPAGHLDRLPICVVDHGDDHHAPTREKAKHTAWLIASVTELYEALKSIQWGNVAFDPAYNLCPLCNQSEVRGHAPDCIVGMALAKARGDAA